MIIPLKWETDRLLMLDQRKLPWRETWITCRRPRDVARGIREMVIRGAPAIGLAAAYGLALGGLTIKAKTAKVFFKRLKRVKNLLAAQRPTAVNLVWALNKMEGLALSLEDRPLDDIRAAMVREAVAMHEADIDINRRIGRHGESLVPDKAVILTHCNAGALATGGYGTALGVVRAAVEAGKKIEVLADETRPFLQGARLTAWELHRDGIPVTVITDNMAGHFLKSGLISLVVVGADRIAANGDTANKIGTYPLAVVAGENKVPFYVAAPLSTIDRNTASGDDIPIEERPAREVTHVRGRLITPAGVKVLNPAFDVTPSRYITAIITEAGLAEKPDARRIQRLFD